MMSYLFSSLHEQGRKTQKMFRRADKAIFLPLALNFLSQKRITSKTWTDIPKTLSKIWVKIFKCKIMLFKANILMKMKL